MDKIPNSLYYGDNLPILRTYFPPIFTPGKQKIRLE